jgi:SAM-dependent methyltransferase
MLSQALSQIIQCPDCTGRLDVADDCVRCSGCGRQFGFTSGVLDLRPIEAFAEQTKDLDDALHADARHTSITRPVLGSKIRNDMLNAFLRPSSGDRIVDLGCGNGRALAWNASSGASLFGVDVSPHFAPEAVAHSDLVLGDLRRLPLKAGAFNKAWSLDVFEHLSPQVFRDVLTEAGRVLSEDGVLFMYTHVRENGPLAGGVRMINRLARGLERIGLVDLRQERLRKSDHLNPIADHAELRRVASECGFRIERITYYTPIVGAVMENILARMTERWLTRRAARRSHGAPADDSESLRAARTSAQARVGRGGWTYRGLLFASSLMKLDVVLFGRVRSGPFFALLRKTPAASGTGTNG